MNVNAVVITFSWDGKESHQSLLGSSPGHRYSTRQFQSIGQCTLILLYLHLFSHKSEH